MNLCFCSCAHRWYKLVTCHWLYKGVPSCFHITGCCIVTSFLVLLHIVETISFFAIREANSIEVSKHHLALAHCGLFPSVDCSDIENCSQNPSGNSFCLLCDHTNPNVCYLCHCEWVMICTVMSNCVLLPGTPLLLYGYVCVGAASYLAVDMKAACDFCVCRIPSPTQNTSFWQLHSQSRKEQTR